MCSAARKLCPAPLVDCTSVTLLELSPWHCTRFNFVLLQLCALWQGHTKAASLLPFHKFCLSRQKLFALSLSLALALALCLSLSRFFCCAFHLAFRPFALAPVTLTNPSASSLLLSLSFPVSSSSSPSAVGLPFAPRKFNLHLE